MMNSKIRSLAIAFVVVFGLGSGVLLMSSAEDRKADAPRSPKPATGPETEKRFPPLVVPEGFKATLFACDPLVEYPSVIAVGPQPGTLFVAHDYVTGLGIDIVRRDEIRLLRDTDGDGYADTSMLYADGFNSIQGLAYHDGRLYVMHAPLLTVLVGEGETGNGERGTRSGEQGAGNGDSDSDAPRSALRVPGSSQLSTLNLERRDLLNGLGLPPEENPNRLHCANGVAVGHDGWLYLALGDRGCDVRRPEGDRLLFREGGILRCRPDGSDLHVFSRGLRNIYDVALDAELNVFVRDNENDGGDYMIRVCHSFHGADHGYPYLYNERPDEAMRPLADLGRGSSAGGTAYLEASFPQEHRESLFFCEWGRAVVRYRLQPAGSGFSLVPRRETGSEKEPGSEERAGNVEIDVAAGAADDPYGFKPTDVVVDRDGSLLISDWGDGQRPQRGRGRIYRITYVGGDRQLVPPASKGGTQGNASRATDTGELVKQLDSPSYYVRVAAQEAIARQDGEGVAILKQAMKGGSIGVIGRLHAVWVLAHVGGERTKDDLFQLADHDADPRVRAQAVRALADLVDPVLAGHRLDAGRGDEEICRRLARLGEQADPRVSREAVIALGRLKWSGAADWLRRNLLFPGSSLKTSDPAMVHAAMILLRRSDNWPAVLDLVDAADVESSVRTIALRALANQANETVVDGLLGRLEGEQVPARRGELIDLLARVHRRPAEWTYWGFRPAPRPANSVDWERTGAIAGVLDRALADDDAGVRILAARRMLRENVPIALAALTQWLGREREGEGVAAILEALRGREAGESRGLFEQVARSRSHTDENRISALHSFIGGLDGELSSRLLEVASKLDEGPALAVALRAVAQHPQIDSSELLLARVTSENDDVRAAAAESLADLSSKVAAGGRAADMVVSLLNDRDVRVRRAAAVLAGAWRVGGTSGTLLQMSSSADLPSRSAGLESLRLLEDSRAVPQAVESLDFAETQLAALSYLGRFGGPAQLDAVTAAARRSRSIDVLVAAVQALTSWESRQEPRSEARQSLERVVAEIQGEAGVVLQWHVDGPLSGKTENDAESRRLLVEPPDAQVRLLEGSRQSASPALKEAQADTVWLVSTKIASQSADMVEFFASSAGKLQVSLNDSEQVYERTELSAYRPDSDRFEGTLKVGMNKLVVRIAGDSDGRFHLRFRRKSSKAEHEQLIREALDSRGNVSRGEELFRNAEKSQCVKCHRIGEQGGRIGPDLAGIGSRFSRIHLVESILDPSRTVAPSYETLVVALDDGRVITGVKVAETETTLMLGDNQAKTHEITKAAIDIIQPQPRSTMPDGLEKRLTEREFVDLVEYLLSVKKGSRER